MSMVAEEVTLPGILPLHVDSQGLSHILTLKNSQMRFPHH